MKVFLKSLLVLTTAIAGFLGGHQLLNTNLLAGDGEFSKPKVALDSTPLVREGKFTASYKDVVDKAAPSVVYIFTSQTLKERQQPPMSQFFDDPFFRRFFGDRFTQPQNPQNAPKQKRQGLGSGVIVSKDGYILTNTHVVEGADEIEVVRSDSKKSYQAKLVGTDPQTDIAVLKIEESNLPTITLADSDHIEVGDVVFAIGNPLGVGQSVTMGIVSAKGRSGFGMTEYEDFIQTDAAINQGNSGGALVDSQGRLIGINTFIVSRSGGYQGLGFAVPVNLARYVMNQLTEHGKVSRGLLGVMIQTVSPDIAEAFDLKDGKGAIVTDVPKDGPAAKAGVEAGDIVVAINGKEIDDHHELRSTVAQTAPGTKVRLKVIRDGNSKHINVTLGELEGESTAKKDESGEWGGKSDLLDGVEVNDLTEDWRKRYRIPENVEGVLVVKVDPESPAYAAGLRSGNVIAAIDRQPVKTAKEAVELSERTSKDKVLLLVRTPQGARYLVVKKDN